MKLYLAMAKHHLAKRERKETSAFQNTLWFYSFSNSAPPFCRLSPGACGYVNPQAAHSEIARIRFLSPRFLTAHFHDSEAGWKPRVFSIW